ncbi:MAG: GtrA family protein [Ketobacter sp.]|nr:GtrA family protein [Ketobacter sp.]
MLNLIKSVNSRFLRFGICAVLATSTHWAVMALLIVGQITPYFATATGALSGAIVNYYLQYHFAFESTRPHKQALVSYCLSCAAGWLANLGVFSFLFMWWPDAVALVQLVTTAIVAFLNYFLYRRMVFDDRVSPRLAN